MISTIYELKKFKPSIPMYFVYTNKLNRSFWKDWNVENVGKSETINSIFDS